MQKINTLPDFLIVTKQSYIVIFFIILTLMVREMGNPQILFSRIQSRVTYPNSSYSNESVIRTPKIH